jgi:hypothetical protein
MVGVGVGSSSGSGGGVSCTGGGVSSAIDGGRVSAVGGGVISSTGGGVSSIAGGVGSVSTSGAVVIVADGGVSTSGGTLATSVGLPPNTVEVVQTRITATPAIIPVIAVSDNFVDKFSGKIERILPKTALHANWSFWKKPGVLLSLIEGCVSNLSTVVSRTPIVPLRIRRVIAFQIGWTLWYRFWGG